MSVNKELWLPVVEENFFAEWQKLTSLAKDDSVYVMQAGAHKKVYIPNAGAAGTIDVNNTTYPVAVEERTDTTMDYDVDSFQMPPVRIGKYDAALLSYDKLASVAKDFMGGIGEHILYQSVNNWYIGKESGKYVETSGDKGATSDAPGSDRTPKKLILADVMTASKILDVQKVPSMGRILLLPPQMFYQLLEDVQSKITINDNDGLLMFEQPLIGFRVVMLPNVLNLANNGAIRAVGHSGTATDIMAGLAYHKDQVSIAKENVYLYTGADRPEYYGDIMSAEAWAGASYRRVDKKGVVPIIQVHTS